MNKQYRCCACEKVFINPDDWTCDCGCVLEIDVEYYVNRIAELEADIVVRDKALVSRNDEIKGLQNYIKMTNAYPEQVTRMLAEWKQAGKEVE